MDELKKWAQVKADDGPILLFFRAIMATLVVVGIAFAVYVSLVDNISGFPELSVTLILANILKILVGALLVLLILMLWCIHRRLQLGSSKGEQEDCQFKAERGVLWHGNEQNISFRIATFKGMLNEIGSSLDHKTLNRRMFESGEKAGEDFANTFGTQIYPTELQRGNRDKVWQDLSTHERLTIWGEVTTRPYKK